MSDLDRLNNAKVTEEYDNYSEMSTDQLIKLEQEMSADYYKTRDRYHLSLQGRYSYTVEGEKHIIKPGTFFWFDNKKYHEAENISDVDRITFVFDLPFGKRNP